MCPSFQWLSLFSVRPSNCSITSFTVSCLSNKERTDIKFSAKIYDARRMALLDLQINFLVFWRRILKC